jgi:hypothetical protein
MNRIWFVLIPFVVGTAVGTIATRLTGVSLFGLVFGALACVVTVRLMEGEDR